MQSNALYYPHIGLSDAALVKAMALHFDDIYRIVPIGVAPRDADELAPLLEEGSVGKQIDPAKYSEDASRAFLDGLVSWNAAALTFDDGQRKQLIGLHSAKMDERVRELFREAGFGEDSSWLHVPTDLASNFMLYLATVIGSKNDLALVTSEWSAWTGSTYLGLDGGVDGDFGPFDESPSAPEESFGLFGLLVDELVPGNIADIPAADILRFRERRRDEIQVFRMAIDALRVEMSSIGDQQLKLDAITRRAEALTKAKADYHRSADIIRAKGWFGAGFMGIPAPLGLSSLLGLPAASAAALAISGLAVGAIFNLKHTAEEIRQLNKSTPASFLLSLENLAGSAATGRAGAATMDFAWRCMEEYVND